MAACGAGIMPDDETIKSSPTASPALWDPEIDDESLIRGEAFVNESQIIVQENAPHQHLLRLSGALPTPCHQLRVLLPEPDELARIWVEVYSLSDPAEICIQVLEPFEASIPLGEFSPREYEVLVNGDLIGSINY
jgi:hypothetical protein